MKIKIFFLFAIVSLLNYSEINAQNEFCITEPGGTDYLESIPIDQQLNSGPYNIRVFTHVIRRSDGTGGMTANELTIALELLSIDLSSHNVCLTHIGSQDILNDDYYNNRWSPNFNNIIATNPHSNAIDLYFAPVTNPSAGGRASGIPGSSLVVGGSWNGLPVYTSHILSHELGHCLGLYHTHHGTTFEGGDDTNQCKELVNGSNCSTCGDYVCDTPADPFLGFNVNTSTCQWNGSGVDATGQAYNPDEKNIMSYTQPICMDYYSSLQGQRFRDMIVNHPILQAVTEGTTCGLCPENLVITTSILGNETQMASKQITATSIIAPTADVTFQAGLQIQLLPDFFAATGCDFHAYIEDCTTSNMVMTPENTVILNKNNQKTLPVNAKALETGSLVLKIHPNPFQKTTIIKYTLPHSSPVALTVTDLAGRHVRQLLDKNQTKGRHQVQFEAEDLVAGMYLVHLQAGSFAKTIKLLLISY